MKKKNIIPLEIKNAASLMGQIGGKVVSKKKLKALRKSSKKGGRRRGVPLVRKTKKKQLLSVLPDDLSLIKNAASLMGTIGGKQKSEKKTLSSRENGALGGAPRKYSFNNGATATLTIRSDKLNCIIPDSVAKDLKAFIDDDKTFPAYHGEKRYNVRIKSSGPDGLYLRRV